MITIKGIKVGTTDITSTFSSENDTKSLEVTAVSLGSITTPEDTVYTGSAITPTPTVKATVNGVVTTLVLDTDYTLSYSNNTNVGQATVTATGKGNYEGTISANWNITGATITVVANDQSYTYDGNFHGTGITVTTVNNQQYSIKYRTTSSGSYNLTSYPTFKNVVNSGYNNVVYFQVTADNHLTYEGSYQLQIYPKEATLAWGDLTWMYDGTEHHTTCVVSNLVSGDSCTVTLYNNSITNIGEIIVSAISLSNTNYSLPSDTTRTLIITAGMFVKLSGVWTPVKGAYKKISGTWMEQEFGSIFNSSDKYIRK